MGASPWTVVRRDPPSTVLEFLLQAVLARASRDIISRTMRRIPRIVRDEFRDIGHLGRASSLPERFVSTAFMQLVPGVAASTGVYRVALPELLPCRDACLQPGAPLLQRFDHHPDATVVRQVEALVQLQHAINNGSNCFGLHDLTSVVP